MPLSVSAEMVNSRKLRDADLSKLNKTSDSEEENVSEYENHISDEIGSDSCDNDFDIDIIRCTIYKMIIPRLLKYRINWIRFHISVD
ncbi:hypothetical protein NPIL_638191 [Nephila pilipes]|uniref:Uncharacterized protein n=1 Tax=Nephila pilipes TaxID=299642 RepID=A0A8X6PTK7_NEPPI|nr:hypothetical protein NPIL_638191 [Nephila pilipes]